MKQEQIKLDNTEVKRVQQRTALNLYLNTNKNIYMAGDKVNMQSDLAPWVRLNALIPVKKSKESFNKMVNHYNYYNQPYIKTNIKFYEEV